MSHTYKDTEDSGAKDALNGGGGATQFTLAKNL